MHCKSLARLLGALGISGAVLFFTAFTAAAASAASLQGAGSTLIAPLEADWASIYDSEHPGTNISFDPVGSGKGEQAIAAGTVDFGASDAPLSAYGSTPCGGCVQIPWGLTATGVGIHVNGIRSLRLSGSVIGQIYTGQIRNWNARAIRALNPHTRLPNLRITPFWRNDASGDTYAFTDYESKVSGSFRRRIGTAVTVNWPTGVGARGNLGMVQGLAATNGGIAYVAVAYLAADWPRVAAIKNRSGRWEVPNVQNIVAAAAAGHLGGNNQIDITNAGGRKSYPISTYTYVIVPRGAPKGSLLRSFIGYALSAQGQGLGYHLDFVPIPGNIRNAGYSTLGSVH